VVTIDDATTTEVDDGLSVEFLEGGRVRLWVHVADPTRWIRPEVALDMEARRRGSTIYLPTGVVPSFT
jgi:exoribonuclease-2